MASDDLSELNAEPAWVLAWRDFVQECLKCPDPKERDDGLDQALDDLVAGYESDLIRAIKTITKGDPDPRVVSQIIKNLRKGIGEISESDRPVVTSVLQMCFLTVLAMSPTPDESESAIPTRR